MAERMGEPETSLDGGSHSEVVRAGQTVRRVARPWASSVHDLLRHLDQEGFGGAPRVLGFDGQGREILTYIEGEVGQGDRLIPDQGGRFDHQLPAFVWRDEALVHLGALIRGYHDAAATMPWTGREWCFEARDPVETICHNELKPSNTIFRSGVPVALIDWDTAAPGPRAWDLGFAAWFWVPFWRDEKCRAAGLPSGVGEKARRFRLLLDAYGLKPDVAIVHAGVERMSAFLGHIRQLAAEGSAHEVEARRRGAVDELALEIAWVQQHAAALVGPSAG
jgi:Phosphotransferase enzyme family